MSDTIFRRKIQKNYPEIARKVIEKPVLTDMSKVKKLHSLFTSLVGLPKNPRSFEITDFRTLFIAIVLMLYDPDYMAGYKKKAKNGLRNEVAFLLGIGAPYASSLFAVAAARVHIYKNIAEDVENLCEVLLSDIGEG